MVELQPSKLTTWVRFSSPAPIDYSFRSSDLSYINRPQGWYFFAFFLFPESHSFKKTCQNLSMHKSWQVFCTGGASDFKHGSKSEAKIEGSFFQIFRGELERFGFIVLLVPETGVEIENIFFRYRFDGVLRGSAFQCVIRHLFHHRKELIVINAVSL